MSDEAQNVEHYTGPYKRTPIGYFFVKSDGAQESNTPLTTFDAVIIGDLYRDDGVETVREFEIEAGLDGSPKVIFRVPAARFANVERWALENLGAGAIVTATPNAEKRAREAIQRYSYDRQDRRVFTHTGWTNKIDGRLIYLHAGGGIGPDGHVDVEVELPKDLQQYRLPAPPTGRDLIEAVRASLLLLNLAPIRITAPAFCSTYRAPLGHTDFTIWFAGLTGTFKTELTTLCMQHYGPFTSRSLPGSWEATANYLEMLAFTAKDALLPIDDFVPHGTALDRQQLQQKAARLIREQGNGSARGRLQSDMTMRCLKPPRGMNMVTGEELPAGHSVRGRCGIIEIEKGDISPDKLTAIQAEHDRFPLAMAAYLQHLARNRDEVHERKLRRVPELRQQAGASEACSSSPRMPSMIAELAFAAEVFLDFAVEADAITRQQRGIYWKQIWDGLLEAAARQGDRVDEQDSTVRYIELLQSAIASGHAHVAATDGKTPATPAAWGWRVRETGAGADSGLVADEVWDPRGDRIGWVDGAALYLDRDASFKVAQAMATDGGIPISATTLARRLNEKGLLAETGKSTGRETYLVRKNIECSRRAVLALRAHTLMAAMEVQGE